MTKFELEPISASTITTLERPHPLVWIGSIGSYNALLFTILYYFVFISGSVIELITSKVKKLICLNFLCLFPPKKKDKSTVLHKILNVQILRSSEFHPKTYFGVCLTLIYFLIMFVIFLFLVVDNYTSLFNDRGPTISYSVLNTKLADIRFEKTFTCTAPSGCFVGTLKKKFETPDSCMNANDVIQTGNSVKLVFCYQTIVDFYLNQKNPVPNFPTLNEFGYLTDVGADANAERYIIQSYNAGVNGAELGTTDVIVTVENFYNFIDMKIQTNIIPK
jgi:hypothetical protein